MSAASVAEALGGYSVLETDVRTEFDLATAAMAGLASRAASRLVESGRLKAEELYELVIPRRTFDRRVETKQRLTVTESDRLLRTTRVLVRAEEALGSAEKAATWLRTSNRSLRGAVPITLLETDIGARMVERTLGRIEHGVLS